MEPVEIEGSYIPTRFRFDRYINGELMAQGVVVENQKDLSMAMKVATRIAEKGVNGESPVLVLDQTYKGGANGF